MRISSGNAILNVEILGDGGNAVLLLHGLGGSHESWHDLPRLLAHTRRVIVPDLRGCGASERGSEPYSFATLARDAIAVLDTLGIARCHLVGHSLGGVIAQELLTSHGARCASAVLISTSSFVGEKAATGWLKLADHVARNGLRPSHAAAERGFSEPFARDHPDVVRDAAKASAASNPSVYAEQARIAAAYDYSTALARVAQPVLILQGLGDRVTGPGGSVLLSRALPNAELRMLDAVGHNLHVELGDRLAAILDVFFDGAEDPEQPR